MNKFVSGVVGALAAGAALVAAPEPAKAQVGISIGFGTPGWGYGPYAAAPYWGWRAAPVYYGAPWGYSTTRVVYRDPYFAAPAYAYPRRTTRVVYAPGGHTKVVRRVVHHGPHGDRIVRRTVAWR